MQITDIEIHEIHPPLAAWNGDEVRLSSGDNWDARTVVVLRCDNGLEGITEWEGPPRDASIADVEQLRGTNPCRWLAHPSLPIWIAPAIYDLVGKANDVPAYQLFGPKIRSWVPVASWTVSQSPQRMAMELEDAVRHGHRWRRRGRSTWRSISAEDTLPRDISHSPGKKQKDLIMQWDFSPEKKIRVIVNTDAKNEADDQYAIVHAILTPAFELHGIIPAHFGTKKSPHTLKDSHDETLLLLRLMGLEGQLRVEDGAEGALPDVETPVESPGARLIIEEALKDDPRPLHVAFYGPLTDMASALLLEPKIAQCDIRCIWIGGGAWPLGGGEYNLSNDIHAANVVMRSTIDVWQIPSTVYRRMPASYAELYEKVYDKGEIGKYLVEQLIEHNARRPTAMEFRSLGDSPAVGVMIYPDCGAWQWQPAPEFEPTMHYRHTGRNRPIRVYSDIDARFIHEDFFAKLAIFVREKGL